MFGVIIVDHWTRSITLSLIMSHKVNIMCMLCLCLIGTTIDGVENYSNVLGQI